MHLFQWKYLPKTKFSKKKIINIYHEFFLEFDLLRFLAKHASISGNIIDVVKFQVIEMPQREPRCNLRAPTLPRTPLVELRRNFPQKFSIWLRNGLDESWSNELFLTNICRTNAVRFSDLKYRFEFQRAFHHDWSWYAWFQLLILNWSKLQNVVSESKHKRTDDWLGNNHFTVCFELASVWICSIV